jgi:hypothetical protein
LEYLLRRYSNDVGNIGNAPRNVGCRKDGRMDWEMGDKTNVKNMETTNIRRD